MARRLYEAILGRIEAQGYDVFARRAETSLPTSYGSRRRARSGIRGRLPRGFAAASREDCNFLVIVL